VWRPGDARETVAAWRSALERADGPSVLALTRQAVPILDCDDMEKRAARGAYVAVPESGGAPELVIAASGSELHLAVEAAGRLAAEGRAVRVVSVPCQELFADQPESYRREVLPAGAPRLLVEAGVEQGVATLMREGDRFHGMKGFGASASYQKLAEHFGFTTDAVVASARELLA